MSAAGTILWFRRDLRMDDNAALRAAAERGGPVIPVFVAGDPGRQPWKAGAASCWWLHHSLADLDGRLRTVGLRLVLRAGPPGEALRALARETGATAVYWNRVYEASEQAQEAGITAELRAAGLDAESFRGALLHEPATTLTRSGQPFQVFTPFWRCVSQEPPESPRPAPRSVRAPARWPASLSLRELRLRPDVDWAGGLREAWRPGESGAQVALARFARGESVPDYEFDRDRPDLAGTSRLSAHLHFGEVSPRRIRHALTRALQARAGKAKRHREDPGRPLRTRTYGTAAYLRQLGWREFAHHLLYHFPRMPIQPLREEWEAFPWREDAAGLRAWQRGRTGYPIVDAGMRELWRTGWMHNRVRMVAASFLVKDLLIHWLRGAEWFWDTLVDADLANNTLGWQWVTGCGAGAPPFFRVFNPVLQGRRFDPRGEYVRRWVPELAGLPGNWIHAPWLAPAQVLGAAGVRLGETYPRPIVDHDAARVRALHAWRSLAAIG